jgi:hypothetical protein
MTLGNQLTAYAEQAAVGRVCLAVGEPGHSRYPGSHDFVERTVIPNDHSGNCWAAGPLPRRRRAECIAAEVPTFRLAVYQPQDGFKN